MKSFLTIILLLSSGIYLLSGCSDITKSKADSFTELIILPSNKTVPVEAETVDFKAYGIYFDQTLENQTDNVVWSSSDTDVAQIEQDGTATLNALGVTTISAVYNLEGNVYEQSTILSVRANLLQSITILPDKAVVPKGFSKRFRAIGHFNDGDTYNISKFVTWDSSNENVAVIKRKLLSAVAETNVTNNTPVKVTTISVLFIGGDQSASTTLRTTDAKLQSITISPDSAQMEQNETIELTAQGMFSDNSIHDVTDDMNWTCSDESILLLSEDEDEGKNFVTATSQNVLGDVNVTATEDVKIMPAKDSIEIKVVE